MKIIDDRYLGDGVYASFDGFHIVLDLRAQDTTTKICMEQQVLLNLQEYTKAVTTACRKYHDERMRQSFSDQTVPAKSVGRSTETGDQRTETKG